MHLPTALLTLFITLSLSDSAPTLSTRQAKACFVIGSTALPAEVQDTVTTIQSAVTCDTSTTTLSGVPDTVSGNTYFSSINFASSSSSTPLAFALSEFATDTPLASTSLSLFQDQLNVYQATEAGIRSVDGNLAIKAPKFFLSFQMARINTAQGTAITDPGQTVEHLLGKVVKNAGSAESQATKDAVAALAGSLA
ncbi:hypothetical protein LSUE1_G007352 [Lachnellula suecica]|uniref:DUF7143 domain-containing protein n=1 Tax=Lachnellula suecica TaxID=602035 RepID=A0A8T9BSD8_9HELO|nr:hypothetical protein LSUE1_G007352 [Lachnellula suecica]